METRGQVVRKPLEELGKLEEIYNRKSEYGYLCYNIVSHLVKLSHVTQKLKNVPNELWDLT